MTIRAWAPAALIAAALLSGFENVSEACSPAAPGLTGSIPANGEAYPANAAVFFLGYELTLDGVTVTVNGAPASFVKADAVSALGLTAHAVLVSPAPAAGQTVEIKGDFCPPAYMCEPKAFSYVAGAADTSAPAAPSSISFNLFDYPDFKSGGGDCQSDSDLGWWITSSAEPPAQGESLVLLTVEAFRDQGFTDLAFSTSTFVGAPDTAVVVRRTIDILKGAAAPDAMCIRASIIDASGNKATSSASACKPCNYRKDGSATMSDWPPEQPAWTAADAYPGGSCDMGSGVGGGASSSSAGSGGAGGDGNGDDSVTVGGCGCRIAGEGGGERAGGSSAGMAALAALSLLGAARRRRRIQ